MMCRIQAEDNNTEVEYLKLAYSFLPAEKVVAVLVIKENHP